MASMGQTDVTELCAMLDMHETVSLRAAVVQDGDGWRLHHGEVNLAPKNTAVERTWRYETATFLALNLPGPTVTALLQGHPLRARRTHNRGQGQAGDDQLDRAAARPTGLGASRHSLAPNRVDDREGLRRPDLQLRRTDRRPRRSLIPELRSGV